MDWSELNTFLVKEHTGIFKAANNYDVFDIESGEKLLECREPSLGLFTKLFRFTDYKRMTPFHIEIRDTSGNIIVEVKRGISIFLSKVDILYTLMSFSGVSSAYTFRLTGREVFRILSTHFDSFVAWTNPLCLWCIITEFESVR